MLGHRSASRIEMKLLRDGPARANVGLLPLHEYASVSPTYVSAHAGNWQRTQWHETGSYRNEPHNMRSERVH